MQVVCVPFLYFECNPFVCHLFPLDSGSQVSKFRKYNENSKHLLIKYSDRDILT